MANISNTESRQWFNDFIRTPANSGVAWGTNSYPANSDPAWFGGTTSGLTNVPVDMSGDIEAENYRNMLIEYAWLYTILRRTRIIIYLSTSGGTVVSSDQTAIAHLTPADVPARPAAPIAEVAKDKEIGTLSTQAYMDRLWQLVLVTRNNTVTRTRTICHSSCHSNCHGSRTRR